DAGRSASAGDEGRDVADGGDEETKQIERLRLDTLREYRLLDTVPEPAFDRVTKMVAELFDVPIALVVLVDDYRQWFKSAHGLDTPETPREISFCQYVIAEDRPVMITDVHGDPRFRDNALV